jgi:hypothetical protein
MFEKITGKCPYQSPTDMGVNMAGSCIFDDAVCQEAARLDAEGLRRMASTATPGGINFMVKDFLAQREGFDMWAQAMEPAIARLAANIPH